MPIQIRLMSWNIEKNQTLARYIAPLMRDYRVDILALLEVPNGVPSFNVPFAIITELNNLTGTAYFRNQWKFHAVSVGDESVVYVWHEDAAVAAHAFKAETYANAPATYVAGKVMRNTANATIYFPTTGYNWSSLPGKPDGRRPAFMSFVTNDGNAPRRFTFLDLHTPFNKATYIQSYSAHIYASSRETTSVEGISVERAANSGTLGLAASLQTEVDPFFTGRDYVSLPALRTGAVNQAYQAVKGALEDEWDGLDDLLDAAWRAALKSAAAALGTIPTKEFTTADGSSMATGCAMAAALAAVVVVSSVGLPTAPAAATASVAAARAAAQAAINAQISNYRHPKKRTSGDIKREIESDAGEMIEEALKTFAFAPVPLLPVNASVIAGDFNVNYPDTLVYTPPRPAKLNNGNAYTALMALTGGPARITTRTTRKGISACDQQRIYTLKTPTFLQHTNRSAPHYVPLDISSLVATATNFVGYDAWIEGLQTLAKAQGITWTTLENYYANELSAAFDMQMINDPAFYRANAYDNFFLRGGTFVSAQLVDVMSELGDWLVGPTIANPVTNPSPPMAANPWPAALGRLNGIVRTQLGLPGAQLTFNANGKTYTITPALADGEEAAVFYDRNIADHLPVLIEIQV